MYSFALFAHVAGVALMFATVGVDLVVHSRMRRASTVAEVRTLAQTISSVSRLHGVSGILIVLAGVYMALASWGWTTPWIDVALVSYVFAGAVGGMLGGKMQAIEKEAAAAPEGLLPPGLAARIHDPALVTASSLLTLWLGGILYLMILKPGWSGSIVTMLVATVIGYLVAMRSGRAGARHSLTGTH